MYEDSTINYTDSTDPVSKAIEKYKNHPSIQAIFEKGPFGSFSFDKVTEEEIKKEIQNLDIFFFFFFSICLDVPHLTNEHRTQDCIAS